MTSARRPTRRNPRTPRIFSISPTSHIPLPFTPPPFFPYISRATNLHKRHRKNREISHTHHGRSSNPGGTLSRQSSAESPAHRAIYTPAQLPVPFQPQSPPSSQDPVDDEQCPPAPGYARGPLAREGVCVRDGCVQYPVRSRLDQGGRYGL